MSFQIKYDKNRFPIRQRREDGTWGCRGCGEAIPKGRKSWCSKKCYLTFDPGAVMRAVRARDHDVCASCGYDCKKARAEWARQCWENKIPTSSFTAIDRITFHKPNYDHIIPFSEGGLTILENIRTLCEPCHKARTKQWHAERKRA